MRRTKGLSAGTSFLGHLTRRFLPGLGFLNILSALMRNRRRSMRSPSSFTCCSVLLAAQRGIPSAWSCVTQTCFSRHFAGIRNHCDAQRHSEA